MDPNALTQLTVNGETYDIHALESLSRTYPQVDGLPRSLKVLLENLLRHEDGVTVTAEDVRALATWDPDKPVSHEIAFRPARILMQDFTGVPAICDLAAMRDAIVEQWHRPGDRINPLQPAELVIDHSVQVDVFGQPDALERNTELEFARNRERYAFLRWAQQAFRNLVIIPPDTGIVHQVNLEYLARVVMQETRDGRTVAFPDTLLGTDSHTTMVNGLGVLGWGVGGIEAEAAMLGQPVSMLIPEVTGVRLTGTLPEGTTATDLVLTITQRLRQHGVVGHFVEFFGEGIGHLTLADRATVANMAPEYGATCSFFPVDEETIAYLRLTGRAPAHVALVEAYAKAQGLWHDLSGPALRYSSLLEIDLGAIEPSLAGPRRPQDRVALKDAAADLCTELESLVGPAEHPYDEQVVESFPASDPPTAAGTEHRGLADPRAGHPHPSLIRRRPRKPVPVELDGQTVVLDHGSVVIAAITSCTNTSNPSVLMAAGLLARKARMRGLQRRPWVKSSLAPGSMVVTDYLKKAGLLQELEALGFYVVGYGCTTCIGNSGPLPEPVARAITSEDLAVCAVLSGNRNFEGRIHPLVRLNYLASPPLVVAYALTGTMDCDLTREPLGTDRDGNPVFLRDLWPSTAEIQDAIRQTVDDALFRERYRHALEGPAQWRALAVRGGERYEWDPSSTYIKRPPFFEGIAARQPEILPLRGARVLGLFGDSITTDHISPAGSIPVDSPAGQYLIGCGVPPEEFNSYGARRGNHEVMIRGTFANVRIKNLLVPDRVGGWTRWFPSGEVMRIYDAAVRYRDAGVPLVILAGKEYGTGSSRDWAAKGPRLLGVRAVLAESFERIHRSNLVGLGILPLTFKPGENVQTLGLTGEEVYDIEGLESGAREVTVVAVKPDGSNIRFSAQVRIDTPMEWQYYAHGGILEYMLRQLATA